MTKPMFSKEELAIMVARVQQHLLAEHDLQLGRFEAESLIDFMAGTVGVQCYNRGLHDAQALMAEQMERFNDGIFQLERVMPK
ncbi:DUF2164 domain-containing protein [Rhizobium oryziradicis]|uniref:DUF2164 domain-containing protein n=1 Tax=Rhizobium oryziradicis TaxID=1867956 RepID=A0A1Q8ZRE8_9HYPH|nr:DUF2164 domain-containing protein [Rhizobium oryziradicis]OLP44530.1 hypothetical protein BJF95_08420 [Rhizobium oryziradicis]